MRKIIANVEGLTEIWDILGTCYKRPDKYISEALKHISEFSRYKTADSAAIKEFYSLLMATIKSAKTVGHLKLLINSQTFPNIIGKMPHTDWKQ